MNKRHPFNSIIEKKLEQLPVAGADQLWNDMHSILDKKMPQKKERRRFIWWFFNGRGLVVVFALALLTTGSFLYFAAADKTVDITINESQGLSQNKKSIKDIVVKGSAERKENKSPLNETVQVKKDNLFTTKPFPGAGSDDAIGYNINGPQTIKQSKKYRADDPFIENVQPVSIANPNTNIEPVSLRSIKREFLIVTDHNRKIDSLLEEAGLTTNKLNSNPRNNDKRGFYTGIMSGLDLSAVRFRSLKTGTTKGFIIGYAFNKRWSIESGLLWDTKRVYDDGSHFTPPGYTPSSGITIVAVNGKSRLYELPVNIKYTIIPGKHSLFATTGLSSYFMRSENYDYKYVQSSQPGGRNYLSYKNATRNWLSVVNLSAGYTYQLRNMGTLRVEPYLKLPVKNIGVGKMPIMSTGLNIGFIKPIR